jgi:hypothetical protein
MVHPRSSGAAAWLALALALAACDDKPAPTAAPAPSAAPAATAEAPKPAPAVERVPTFVVDEQGPMLDGARFDVANEAGVERLRAAVAAAPLKGKTVAVSAVRNAKTQQVTALVEAIAAAGAAEVDVATPGRSGVKGPLKLTPASMVASSPDCSVVAAIRKDGTSAVWRLRGGAATRFAKGFAGPDLSMTFDGIEREAKGCASTNWFFGGEDGTVWGLVFDLGASVQMGEKPSKLSTTVLLTEAPIPGRPVKLGKP